MPGGAGAGDTAVDSCCPHGAYRLRGKVDSTKYLQVAWFIATSHLLPPSWKFLPQNCRWQSLDLGTLSKTVSRWVFNHTGPVLWLDLVPVRNPFLGPDCPYTVTMQSNSNKWQLIMVVKNNNLKWKSKKNKENTPNPRSVGMQQSSDHKPEEVGPQTTWAEVRGV